MWCQDTSFYLEDNDVMWHWGGGCVLQDQQTEWELVPCMWCRLVQQEGGVGVWGTAGAVLKITAAERGWRGLSAVPLRLMLFAPTHFYPPFPHLCPTSAENRCSRLLSCEGLLGDRVLMWQHGTFDWKWVTQMWVYKFIIVTISLLSLTCSFLEKSSLVNYISQTLLFQISPMLFISKLLLMLHKWTELYKAILASSYQRQTF